MSEITLLPDHFAPVVGLLERRVAESADARRDYFDLFNAVEEDLFFTMLARSQFPEMAKLKLPGWPSEEVRKNSTSDIPMGLSMLEAATFWRAIKRHMPSDMTNLRVADYGAGWGRISRFAAKDVRDLYAFEPNPDFGDLYESCRLPGTLVRTDWLSASPLTDHGKFDLIYCFSILTHSSDLLTRNIAARWAELTKPGSMVFTTIRPKYFIDGESGDAALLNDKPAMHAAYQRGELVYSRYSSGSGEWGVTVMPLGYIDQVFGQHFSIVGCIPSPTTMNQMMVVLQRR